MRPSVDDILALDILTLRDHTEQAGVAFDEETHRANLTESLAHSDVCAVWREAGLVAYAMLRPEAEACWFVGAFATHPSHRTFSVLAELLTQVATLARERGIQALRSHVYKTNRLSLAFHRKLGFQTTRENEKAVEFYSPINDLARASLIRRVESKATSPAVNVTLLQ